MKTSVGDLPFHTLYVSSTRSRYRLSVSWAPCQLGVHVRWVQFVYIITPQMADQRSFREELFSGAQVRHPSTINLPEHGIFGQYLGGQSVNFNGFPEMEHLKWQQNLKWKQKHTQKQLTNREKPKQTRNEELWGKLCVVYGNLSLNRSNWMEESKWGTYHLILPIILSICHL